MFLAMHLEGIYMNFDEQRLLQTTNELIDKVLTGKAQRNPRIEFGVNLHGFTAASASTIGRAIQEIRPSLALLPDASSLVLEWRWSQILEGEVLCLRSNDVGELFFDDEENDWFAERECINCDRIVQCFGVRNELCEDCQERGVKRV